MVAFGFKQRFKEDIILGNKTQTIRKFSPKKWDQLKTARTVNLHDGWRFHYREPIGTAKLDDLFFLMIELDYEEYRNPDDGFTKIVDESTDIPREWDWNFDSFRLLVDWEPRKNYWEIDHGGSRAFSWRDLEVHPVNLETALDIINRDGFKFVAGIYDFFNFFYQEYNLVEDFFIGIRWKYPFTRAAKPVPLTNFQ